MFKYPSIEGFPLKGEKFYGFDKLDGSNVSVEWRAKKGFTKFGRRNGLLDHSSPILLQAIPIIYQKYVGVGDILKRMRIHHATLFFEFFGVQSSFGCHVTDDEYDVVLIDVWLNDNKSFISPKDFIKHFALLGIPRVVFEGYVDRDVLDSVRNDELPGMTHEGVVFKSKSGRMFKAKTQKWYDELKSRCGDNEKLFEELK